jgi:hypothetical protein
MTMLAAAVAIGSKFLIRVGGKHVFNPANFAMVALSSRLLPVLDAPSAETTQDFLQFFLAGIQRVQRQL